MAAPHKPTDDDSPIGMDPDADTDVVTEDDHELQTPRQFHVLLHNDDYTTMEFVVLVLMTVFHRSNEEAVEIMLAVHQQGVGVAGTYSYEVAEAKTDKVMRMAREQEFPLRASVEPVDS